MLKRKLKTGFAALTACNVVTNGARIRADQINANGGILSSRSRIRTAIRW